MTQGANPFLGHTALGNEISAPYRRGANPFLCHTALPGSNLGALGPGDQDWDETYRPYGTEP